MAHVILFEKPFFHGNHKHVFRAEANLNASDDDSMNDKTQSIVVLEGEWQFFRDWNFEQPSYLGTLGPGLYTQLGQYLGGNAINSISRLQPIDTALAKPAGHVSTAPGRLVSSNL